MLTGPAQYKPNKLSCVASGNPSPAAPLYSRRSRPSARRLRSRAVVCNHLQVRGDFTSILSSISSYVAEVFDLLWFLFRVHCWI
jgi:hypothetical protein